MNWMFSLFGPLMLHMAVSELTAVLFCGRLDSAALTAVSSIIIVPLAAGMYHADRKKEDCRIARDDTGKRKLLLCSLLCFAAGGLLNLIWSGVLNLFHIQDAFSNQAQEALLASKVLIQIAGPGLLVPLTEELVFRGLIFVRMKQMLSVKQSVVFSALLFAVYHGNPIQMIFSFPMAIVLAVILERGKWIGFPVLFHMGANLTAIAVNVFL